MSSVTSSMPSELEEVKSSLNYSFAMVAIFSSFVCHSPSLSYKPPILFFFRLWLALRWKNFVFLSLAGSHIDLDLYLQNTSSWCRSSFISLFTYYILSKFAPYPASFNAFSSLCFASNRSLVFPKVVLLHALRSILHSLIFSKRQYMGLPVGRWWFHEFLIMDLRSVCANHFSSNRWILCFQRWDWFGGAMSIKIGPWSE